MKDEDEAEVEISHKDLLVEIRGHKEALITHVQGNAKDHNRIVVFLEKLGSRIWGIVGMIFLVGLGIIGAAWQMFVWFIDRHEKILHAIGAIAP